MGILTYHIVAFHCGLDQILGLSAGLKHFGNGRCGRSGLGGTGFAPDHVWDIDCTRFFMSARIGGFNSHGAYFEEDSVREVVKRVPRGIDRKRIIGQLR
jgi:hypothetical protein